MEIARDDDGRLLDELRAALTGFDDVPDPVVAAARSAYDWRTLDAELAALSYDSFLDDKELAGVRSAGAEPRLLTFESARGSVEIEVAQGRIVGQLVPPQTGTVEVRHPGGSVSVQADEFGRFSCGGIPPGPVSLRCVPADAVAMITEWFVL